jgi:hypothetical protein
VCCRWRVLRFCHRGPAAEQSADGECCAICHASTIQLHRVCCVNFACSARVASSHIARFQCALALHNTSTPSCSAAWPSQAHVPAACSSGGFQLLPKCTSTAALACAIKQVLQRQVCAMELIGAYAPFAGVQTQPNPAALPRLLCHQHPAKKPALAYFDAGIVNPCESSGGSMRPCFCEPI